jgi:hypothetical protein
MFGKGQHFYSILHLRRLRHGHLRCIQHILNKYAAAAGGITDQHVGDGADELAVL